MTLKDLKKELPYKWRVQSFSKSKPTAQCVAYIDARDVMDLLDEVCGANNWQDAFKNEGNMLFAGIGIKCGENWVFKWDTGSESNIEKEKGHSSDAFKRAGVKWGIGRFLYSLKIHNVASNGAKNDQNKYPYVVDHDGKRVWDITEYINGLNGKDPKMPKAPEPPKTLTCDELMYKMNSSENVFELKARWKKYATDISALSDADKKKVTDEKNRVKAIMDKKGEK